jgi:hypothetical protein
MRVRQSFESKLAGKVEEDELFIARLKNISGRVTRGDYFNTAG